MAEKFTIEVLKEALNGNDAEIVMMAGLFLELTPPLLDEMEKAIDEQHWHEAGDLAHKLKSSVRLMGIRHLHETILSIEKDGRQGQHTDTLAGRIHYLRQELEAALDEIRQYVDSQKS